MVIEVAVTHFSAVTVTGTASASLLTNVGCVGQYRAFTEWSPTVSKEIVAWRVPVPSSEPPPSGTPSMRNVTSPPGVASGLA